MKNWKYVLLPTLGLIAILAMGAVLDTQRDGWSKPQDANGTDDTLLSDAAGTMLNANIPSQRYVPRSRHNAVDVCWTMAADGESCTATLFAARKGGDIVLVWTGTLTAGKQESTSRYYVDTVASGTATWAKGVGETDIGGADRVSRITFDTMGYYYFFFQYENLSSESIQAQYSGY